MAGRCGDILGIPDKDKGFKTWFQILKDDEEENVRNINWNFYSLNFF